MSKQTSPRCQLGSFIKEMVLLICLANIGTTNVSALVPQPPQIITQPVGGVLRPGQSITLNVTATGFPSPVYQWRLNGNPISGAQSFSLTLTNIGIGQTGTYSVLVSNTVGWVVSSNAIITLKTWTHKVAVYGAAPANRNEDVKQKLLGTGLFTQVDTFFVTSGYAVPTLSQLQSYDAILVYSDNGFNDNVTMGNVLADYVDRGGSLVLATFVFWNTNALSIQGRLKTGNYLPFTTGGQQSPGGLGLVKDLANHPILEGVTVFDGGGSSYHNVVDLASGAILVAHWSNGRPLIGAKEMQNGRIVGLNFYPPSSDSESSFWASNTDGARLMANALRWAAWDNEPVKPKIIAEPESRTVPLGAPVEFQVKAMGSPTPAYQWRLNGTSISKATNAIFRISQVNSNDLGLYSVVVSNSAGSVTSINVRLSRKELSRAVAVYGAAPVNRNEDIKQKLLPGFLCDISLDGIKVQIAKVEEDIRLKAFAITVTEGLLDQTGDAVVQPF